MIMKKYASLLIGIAGCVLASCSSVQFLSFDQLCPADVSFPEQLRNVAVVNNMPPIPSPKSGVLTLGHLEGDGKISAEALAESLADTRYFDQVIICDSALRSEGSAGTSSLSARQVEQLTRDLGADAIFSFDRVQIETRKEDVFYPEFGAVLSVAHVKLTPQVQVYVPGRDKPLFTLVKTDSLGWEIDPTVSDKTVIPEVSSYAASILTGHLVPHWVSADRIYFDGGCADMRDAGVSVREGDWKAAQELWTKLYEASKKGNLKMKSAFNLALSYEMLGDMNQAVSWLEKAKSLVKPDSDYAQLVSFYDRQLQERLRQWTQLNIQMHRFDNNF